MESLTLFAFFGVWVLLGLLAARFGVDSRDGIEVQTPRRLWDLPSPDRPTDEQGPVGSSMVCGNIDARGSQLGFARFVKPQEGA